MTQASKNEFVKGVKVNGMVKDMVRGSLGNEAPLWLATIGEVPEAEVTLWEIGHDSHDMKRWFWASYKRRSG